MPLVVPDTVSQTKYVAFIKKFLPCIYKFLNGQIVNLAKPMAKALVEAPELQISEIE